MTHLKFWCHGGMDTFLTAKLKLHTTPEQFHAVRQTQLAYRDGLNFVSRYAFEHGKLSNTITLTLCGVAVESRCKRPLYKWESLTCFEEEPAMSAQQKPDRPTNVGGSAESAALARMRRRADLIEELLDEARKRGDFDHLEGAGAPLDLQKNVYAGDKALAYSLLKQNQMAPPEIERGKEIDAELARADQLLARLRRQRDIIGTRRGPAFVSERRAYNVLRENTQASYTEMLRVVNSKILSLNIIAPSALHRRTIDIEARLRAFEEEFPPLAE